MGVALAQVGWLALLPVVLGLIYFWYLRRRAALRPAAGLWLWQRAKIQGRRNRRLDARLLVLLLAATLMLLALSQPTLEIKRPGPLVVVIDASASMAAGQPSRLQQAIERLRPLLQQSPQAVLLRAGNQVQLWGPSPGADLLDQLDALQATDNTASIEQALSLGSQSLPNARSLVVSDQGFEGSDALWNLGSPQANLGVVAIGEGFVALANSASSPWEGTVQVSGQSYPVRIGARGYARLEVATPTPSVRLPPDTLAADNQAGFSRRAVRVQTNSRNPALLRLLSLLGTTASGNPELRIVEASPPATLSSPFTLYFASQGSPPQPVSDVERTNPLLQGIELQGYSLPPPPAPVGEGWQPLISGPNREALAWQHPNAWYLPPIEAWQNLPAFPVLLFNVVAPLGERRNGLLSPSETLLPQGGPDRPLPPLLRLELSPWLALLAAMLLLLEGLRYGSRRLAAVG